MEELGSAHEYGVDSICWQTGEHIIARIEVDRLAAHIARDRSGNAASRRLTFFACARFYEACADAGEKVSAS
jgi:hypothetical protein